MVLSEIERRCAISLSIASLTLPISPNKWERCRTVRYCMPEETRILKREKER